MGEGIRRAGGGEEGKLGRKTGAAEVEAYEALPRRTGTAGDGEETGQRRGRNGWGGRQGRPRSKPTRQCLVEQGPLGTDRGPLETEGRLAGNGDRDRWERGQEPLATACSHYQLSSKSSRQTRSLTLRNGSKYAFLRHDKTGGYNLPRNEHCNAGVL